jgi:ell wall binding domain 2 (CWB2)
MAARFSPVFRRVRYLLSDVAYQVRGHPVGAAVGVLVLAGVVVAAVFGIGALTDDDDTASLAPAPEVVVRTEEPPEEPTDLGFPAFATSNTTRVAGPDSVAVAAGTALAVFPGAGGVEGPNAVTIVPADDWAAGIAAASLVNEPVGAPILMSEGDELPELTALALESLDPQGSAETEGRQAFVVGSAPEPDGAKTTRIEGANAAEIGAEVALLREELTGEEPAHLLVASSDDPEFAMPAAAWAARSGDPVLFAQRDSVPRATLDLIERYRGVPVYLLGPESVISAKAEREIGEATRATVTRAGDEDDPVANAVAFARFVDGTFGWNINDPGHGFVIASLARPADAPAAAALSGSGTWGPLLLTDDASSPPADLESYLLDMKPGYEDDPTRAVYNHLWIVGDESAISVDFQVEVDEIAEVAPIRSGSGESILGPEPGTPEPEGQGRDQSNGADRNP